MNALLRKRKVSDIDPSLLREPFLSEEDRQDYARGWVLFNSGLFWEAHEAWEAVWKRRPEESRVFFQGIIQMAAAYHLILVKKRYRGALGNLNKAEGKLQLFPSRFLGVPVETLLHALRTARTHLEAGGAEHIGDFDRRLIPHVEVDS